MAISNGNSLFGDGEKISGRKVFSGHRNVVYDSVVVRYGHWENDWFGSKGFTPVCRAMPIRYRVGDTCPESV